MNSRPIICTPRPPPGRITVGSAHGVLHLPSPSPACGRLLLHPRRRELQRGGPGPPWRDRLVVSHLRNSLDFQAEDQAESFVDTTHKRLRQPSDALAETRSRKRRGLGDVGDRGSAQTRFAAAEANVAGSVAARQVRGQGHRQDPARSTSVEKVGLHDDDRAPLVGDSPPDLATNDLRPLYHSSSPMSRAQTSAT